MGEAKRRGTFEHRQELAIEAAMLEEQEREQKRLEQWSKMSRAEQNRRLRTASLMVAIESLKDSQK